MNFIKVCGITDENQAVEVAKQGATHIGVIHFEKSPRHIPLEKIKSIKEKVSHLPVKVVAVVVNPSKELVENLFKVVDVVQLHGDETVEFAKEFDKEKIIKAVRMKDENSLKILENFSKEGFLVLVDAFKKGEYGGTGQQIDEHLITQVSDTADRFILSGGLSEENVYHLIKKHRPYGVDASSKLEISAGIKDLQKVESYIKNAQKAFKEILL